MSDIDDGIGLAGVPESGAVPDSRLKDVATAREIFEELRDSDDRSSKLRAKVQAMFDGSPPYDPAQLQKTQQSYRCNLNFGEAESLLEYAMGGYVDMLHSVEDLLVTPTLFGEENERNHYTTILSREITRTLREWPQFYFNVLHLCTEFVAHGLGVAHFEDNSDWRFRACGQSDFYVPRGTLASEDELDIAMARRVYPLHTIWSKIKNGAKPGWNVAAVRKALAKAAAVNEADATDYEKLEAELKNNDYTTRGRSAKLKLIHAWVREFDGTVTHHIFTEDGDCKEFLFTQRGYFGSMQQGFVMFPYGLGTNSHYHGVRGLGYKIFPAIQVSNRLRSQLIDGAMLASSEIIQVNGEAEFSTTALTYYGTYAMLAPGATIVNRSQPNFAQSVLPVLGDMSTQLQNRTGQYTVQSVFNTGRERTRYEVAAHLEQAAKVSVTSQNLFYQPWDRLLREMVRRMIRSSYVKEDPGGEAVLDLKKRLARQGVPDEAFKKIDIGEVRAVRAVGAGSQAAREASLNGLLENISAYDPVGRHNILRDLTVTRVGASQADRYIPRDPGPRLPVDSKIAVLENQALTEGKQIEVEPEENHVVHLDKHLEALGEFIAQSEEGVPIEELVPRMFSLYEHSFTHLEFVQGDVTQQEIVAAYRQSLQQSGEIISNGMKRIAKLQREQQQAAPEEGQADPNQAAMDDHSMKMQMRLEEHQFKLRRMEEEFVLKQNLKIQDAATNRALRDADKAAELRTLLQ